MAAVAPVTPRPCHRGPGLPIPVSSSAMSRERQDGFLDIVTIPSTGVATIMTQIVDSFSSLPRHGGKLRTNGALLRKEPLGLLSEQKTLIPMAQIALPTRSTGPSGAGSPR